MEEKKQGKGLVVALVLFILTTLATCGYIVYDKVLTKDNVSKEVNTKKEENKELDINSRLVQDLYNNVSTVEMNGTCRYGYYTTDNFYVKNNSEEDMNTKMHLLGRQLSREGMENILPESQQIEKEIKEPHKAEDGTEIFMYYHLPNNWCNGYRRDYIDKMYKKLFGKDAKLDTSLKIPMDTYNAEVYIYNEKLGKYILYQGEGGGTCGPQTVDVSISKAVLKGNTLKIYEEEKIVVSEESIVNDKKYRKGDLLSEDKFVYTFKLEDDGMYSFVSRVKEK